VDHLVLLLVLAPVTRRPGPNTVLILDGTLVPSHDCSVPPPARTAGTRPTCRLSSTSTPSDRRSQETLAGQPQRQLAYDGESGVDRQCTCAAVMANGGY
jgi:hypothetical protein